MAQVDVDEQVLQLVLQEVLFLILEEVVLEVVQLADLEQVELEEQHLLVVQVDEDRVVQVHHQWRQIQEQQIEVVGEVEAFMQVVQEKQVVKELL